MANERCGEEEAEATLSNLKMEGRCLIASNGFRHLHLSMRSASCVVNVNCWSCYMPLSRLYGGSMVLRYSDGALREFSCMKVGHTSMATDLLSMAMGQVKPLDG